MGKFGKRCFLYLKIVIITSPFSTHRGGAKFMSLEGRLKELERTSSSIVTSTVNTVDYPFIFLNGVTRVELQTLSPLIKEGDFPLMVKFSGDKYVRIGSINMNLHSMLSLFKYSKRSIFIQEDKDHCIPLEDLLPEMMLQDP